MPRVANPLESYMKAEAYGQPNTGKSTFAYSICNVRPPKSLPNKKKIIVFTNEVNYSDTLKLFPKKQDMFEIWVHNSLPEFEGDWNTFCEDYDMVETKFNDRGQPYINLQQVREKVHAVILDEAEMLYREGYIARHAQDLANKGIDFQPKDYGVPRSWFTIQINRLAMLPCHFIMCAKVKSEYEAVNYQRKDGTVGSLQFLKTGEDAYRLPENILYMPNLSMHLFKHSVPQMTPGTDGVEAQARDELGKPISIDTYWGRARKQKANREETFQIKNPTVVKARIELDRIRKTVKIT